MNQQLVHKEGMEQVSFMFAFQIASWHFQSILERGVPADSSGYSW